MPLTQQLTVTTNDTHILGTCPNSDYSYKVDGTFGSGSIEDNFMFKDKERYAELVKIHVPWRMRTEF